MRVREREMVIYSTPVITSLLLSKTRPCIIVFLVSGAKTTPPPLIPLAAAVGSLLLLTRCVEVEVEAELGAEDSNNPDKI